jgi:hypothetical protein
MVSQQSKWWQWLGEESLSGGIIGRYEGGSGNTQGIWRPSKHSMMISLGYALDQVGLEMMTERMTAQTELIAASTPTDAVVGGGGTIWIEPAHPVYHELDVGWEIDGEPVKAGTNVETLRLSEFNLEPGAHSVSVTVVDPTPFVRDQTIRDSTLTATRTWTVEGGTSGRTEGAIITSFAGSTQTERPVGGKDALYVGHGHPQVTWRVNGELQPNPDNRRTLQLANLALREGTHTVVATPGSPAVPGSGALTWTVDNTPPTVAYELSQPDSSTVLPDGTTHYFMTDQFTMKLTPTDDQPGYVVAEFRVNGDGWHHYYGWPDAVEGTPFLFTPRGTNIKELVYGSLSSEGLSPQPWEAREPGWGTHVIEYHGIDAAGNIGPASSFTVTIGPSGDAR